MASADALLRLAATRACPPRHSETIILAQDKEECVPGLPSNHANDRLRGTAPLTSLLCGNRQIADIGQQTGITISLAVSLFVPERVDTSGEPMIWRARGAWMTQPFASEWIDRWHRRVDDGLRGDDAVRSAHVRKRTRRTE